jgi:hypothetical protein
MKRNYILVLLLLIPSYLFSDIRYPESLYLEHKQTGYRILLGSIPQYVEMEYGTPLERKMLFREATGAWELWELKYSDFTFMYSTYHNKIMDVTIFTNAFKTSLGIEIGDSEENVLKAYGEPSEIIYNMAKTIIYNKFIPEINSHGQCTYLMFEIGGGIVEKIDFYIDFLS